MYIITYIHTYIYTYRVTYTHTKIACVNAHTHASIFRYIKSLANVLEMLPDRRVAYSVSVYVNLRTYWSDFAVVF